MIQCKRCGAQIQTYYKLRKWCFECRKDLINERARMRNKSRQEIRREELKLAEM